MAPDHISVNSAFFGSGSGSIYNIHCTGNESSILECGYEIVGDTSNCTHFNVAGVKCIGKVYTVLFIQ